MDYKWVPISGEFDIAKDMILFKGKRIELGPQHPTSGESTVEQKEAQATTVSPSAGTLLCNQELNEGILSADVELLDVTGEATCQLILSYDVETTSLISAGIGGWPSGMFDIREWIPGGQQKTGATESGRWIFYTSTGDRNNLKADVPYKLEVMLSGSRVTLYINEVQVAVANLQTPLSQPKPVGIWCVGYGNIRISHFRVEAEKPKAFIVMQFSQPYDQVYSDVIKNACIDFGLEALRADEMYEPGIIIQDVTQQIIKSQIIIADITPANTNVYFEVGYALALNKPIILLAKKGTPLPFDLSAFRVLFYEDSIGGKAKIEEGLRSHLRAILGSKEAR